MTAAGTLGIEDSAMALSDTIEEALGLLREERDIFLTGSYDRLPEITNVKLSLLERLESEIRAAPKSPSVIDLIKQLIDASRRNEEIIAAARQGLAYAKRRIARIDDARKGAVAYAEDGDRIVSRADVLGSEHSA